MSSQPWSPCTPTEILAEVARFNAFGPLPTVANQHFGDSTIPVFQGVFFDPKQRAAHVLHEVPYRASYKASLPRFFIDRLTKEGDVVCDPFLGRGTTALEAALAGRVPWGADVNPLAGMLCVPRLNPPQAHEIEARLADLDLEWDGAIDEGMLAMFHQRTLRQILSLREYLLSREATGQLDRVDEWIRMVALTRLTGHSPGFFSRRTLPPNQAVNLARQARINEKNAERATYRDIVPRIIAKSSKLLSEGAPRPCTPSIHVSSADDMSWAPADSVALVMTSPPFVDLVDYAGDNWARNWFGGIAESCIAGSWNFSDPVDWAEAMHQFLLEARRVVIPGGWIAVEVGDVRGGAVELDTLLVDAGSRAGLDVVLVMINAVAFTRTAHIWRVHNGRNGTATNRVVLLRRPE